jgi:hypothetical protein
MSSLPVADATRLVVQTVRSPDEGLAEVVARRSIAPALIVATLAALLHAAAVDARLDVSGTIDPSPKTASDKPMTPHELEEAIASAAKVATVRAYAGGAFGPAMLMLGVTVALWVGFTVSTRRPSFRPTLAVGAAALIPGAFADLLSIPAVLLRHSITPDEVATVLPSSLGTMLGPDAAAPLAGLLGSFDLFTLWSVVLVVLGMRTVTGTTLTRSAVTTTVLWLSWVAVFRVALPSLMGGQG